MTAALVALAACGSSESGSASSGAASTTTIVATDLGAVAGSTSATPTSAAPTSAASTSSATSAPATTAAGAPDLRSCLQGDWIMKRGTLDLFVATLMPVPGLSMPEGSLSLSFSGDAVVYKGAGTMRFAFGDIVMEADSSWTHTGTFSVNAGGTVLMNWSEQLNEMGEFRVNGGAAPGFEAPDTPPAVTGGPASCTPQQLTFETTSTGTERIQMFFERA